MQIAGEEIERLRRQIMEQIDLTRTVEDEEVYQLIEAQVRDFARERMLTLGEREAVVQTLFYSLRKLDVLQELLEDPTITEIMVNGAEHIFYEKAGRLYKAEYGFSSKEKLNDVIQQMAGYSNRMVNEASPIVDTRLADGSRVNIVLEPVAIDGSAVTIRKFPENPIGMEDLIRMGSISQEAADLLKILVRCGYNIFISGGTGSGKTTFLNALSQYIPREERIITVEDSAELQLLDKPNLVRLETRPANGQGAQEISIRDLIRTALRMRPDRIIVGEVRGAEALDMLQAMNTGHDGSLSTGHANSSRDMLLRLETMALMGSMQLPIAAIRRQIASAIDILVHLGRVRDGTRKVLEISEILGMDQEEIAMKPLFVFSETEGKGADVHGIWKKEGDLQFRKKLEEKGLVSESIETKDGQAVQDGTMETGDERKK